MYSLYVHIKYQKQQQTDEKTKWLKNSKTRRMKKKMMIPLYLYLVFFCVRLIMFYIDLFVYIFCSNCICMVFTMLDLFCSPPSE